MIENAWNNGLGLTLGLTLLILIVIIFLYYKAVRKRQIFLIALSEELGFTFEKFITQERKEPYDVFDLMQTNTFNMSLENHVWGSEKDLDIALFDAKSVLNDGETRRTSVVCIINKSQNIPDFYFGSKNLISFKKDKRVHLDNRDDEIAHYVINGENKDAVKALFNDALIDFLKMNNTLHIEVKANKMLCYVYGKRLKVTEYKSFLETAKYLYGLLCDTHKPKV